MLTTDQRLKMACIHLKHLELERGILINGNITAIAKRSGVKVRDLIKAWQEYKATTA